MARLAFRLLRMLGADRHLEKMACFRWGQTGFVEFEVKYAAHFAALRAMMEVPWWRRIWVVQESVLPRVAVLAYASETCPISALGDWHAAFTKHAVGCCRRFWETTLSTIRRTLDEMFGRHSALVVVRRDWARLDGLTMAALRWHPWSLQATKERDLFYGLLGLVG